MDLESKSIAPRAFTGKEMNIHNYKRRVRLKTEMRWFAVYTDMVHRNGE